MEPKYPIYVISKGRHDCCLTARFLLEDKVPFKLVVEPQEAEAYAAEFGMHNVIMTTPFQNLGQGSIPVRNFVWEHSSAIGAKRHWVIDDNIYYMKRLYKGKRLRCNASKAIRVMEDFTDRYSNVGISGPNYLGMTMNWVKKPFIRNAHVYSFMLIKNDLPFKWRGRWNEDVDLCLQVLAGNLCTIQFNAYMCHKVASMSMKGGNTTAYMDGPDTRLSGAHILARRWPGIVTVGRRWGRPHFKVKNAWKDFKTPLIRDESVRISDEANEYGMKLKVLANIEAPELKEWYDNQLREPDDQEDHA